MTITGTIRTGVHGAGSKSEHLAVYMDTEGGTHRLQRRGGNPFHDEWLLGLAGKTVTLEGEVSGRVFLVDGTEDQSLPR